MTDLPTRYSPAELENRWYGIWKSGGFFGSRPDSRRPYALVIPPPNVTGSLHMGHALNNILQDLIARYRRMRGYNVMWLPGTDHGGIATQNVVEKLLLKERGKYRQDLGRERFLEEMHAWRSKTGDRILDQLEKLGCSCDWSRKRFTMEEPCTTAVFQAFKRLYDKKLIYRGKYIVNFCPRCRTALAEIEVEHQEEKGSLWHIRYPLEGGGHLTVATTRPETMLGDTAVAVNPKDTRYSGIVGRKVVLPLSGRKIPVITDDFVDPQFGTGAVKVTPAHDPNDFAIYQRNPGIGSVRVMQDDAKITDGACREADGREIKGSHASRYVGMERYACREAVIKDLEAQGLLEKVAEHVSSIGHCYRCDTVIEPLEKEQWFLKTSSMADMAIRAAKEGKVRFFPDSWLRPYVLWLENLHDWCISRQIWWGHRIPAWYCRECDPEHVVIFKNSEGNITDHVIKEGARPFYVGTERPTACPAGHGSVFQDNDVLDTWFSSALWPFSTMGWPEKTGDLEYYYPTSVLVTGYEILYLWVARMVMMGLCFLDEVPFSDVYIHGIVRDKNGKKMSKSLGNVIDPLDIIGEYGCDALRFAITSASVSGRDMQLCDENFLSGRNFANKIWNAARFMLMNARDLEAGYFPSGEELMLADRWILAEYNGTLRAVTKALDTYNTSEAARLVYEFFWSKFCDWYIEIIKPRLYRKDGSDRSSIAAGAVLIRILEGMLRVMHPMIPFITEEIWQSVKHLVPGSAGLESVMLAPWPEPETSYDDDLAVEEMSLVIGVVSGVRNIRGELSVQAGRKVDVIIRTATDKGRDLLLSHVEDIAFLSCARSVRVGPEHTRPPKSAAAVVGGTEIYVPLEGLVDLDLERARLEKEIARTRKEIASSDSKLGNRDFVKNAPGHVVDRARQKKASLEEKLGKLELNLKRLSSEG